MQACFALFCHLAVVLLAWRWSYSASGFLLNGPGLALLLDRFVLRVLAWPAAPRRGKDLAGCAAAFVLGTAVFYLLRFGIVPWWEALYRGAIACVMFFLLETLIGLLSPGRPVRRLCLRIAAVGFLVLLIPVAAALHPLHTVPGRTPAAFGLDFQVVRFRTADGLLLAGWIVPHPDAHANLIFCHGHGRNRGHGNALLPTIHALKMNVLSFDFRGHGDSEGHTSTFGAREVGDLVAAAQYLRGRFPGKPLFLVGVSLGADVSLQALPLLPDVRGVWSEGAFARLDRVVANEFSYLPSCLGKPLLALYHALGWLDCGLCVAAVNPVESIRDVTVPIFFCHGRKDELVPLQEGESLYEAYHGPRWQWWVAGAAHYRVRQGNHDEYLRRLRSFLQERLADEDLTK
jgi:alpha-beta hydrolase superfamily lysophospholipase